MREEDLFRVLLETEKVDPKKLNEAMEEHKRTGKKFENILVEFGYISEKDLLRIIGRQTGLPTVDFNELIINPDVVKMIPENICRKYKVLSFACHNNILYVGMVNPRDYRIINDLKFITKKGIKPFLALEKSLMKHLNQYYGTPDAIKEITKKIQKEPPPKKEETQKLEEIAEDAPAIKIVNHLILEAVKSNCTDIHLEPYDGTVRVRYRKDGVLFKVSPPPWHLYPAIVSRIKIMSGLDIAEKRLPQDGRFSKKINGKDIDFRVSTIPSQFGERIVLRILDRDVNLLSLENLGMEEDDLQKFTETIKLPYGMIIITGPTGSGKTTTLYAALNKINHIGHNILTIEDPIEYQLDGISQTQVNEEINLTFATALRSFLRQDPDIIMVGEMRDFETADIAMRAALTGHLVFTTLHTNDAPSAVTRLIDMNIEPFLISSCVYLTIAQRLVRRICKYCKEEYEPSSEKLKIFNLKKGEMKFYRGRGCEMCNNTGYAGRIAIFEMMSMNDEIRELIMKKAPHHLIKATAIKHGMKTLAESGLNLVKKSITTIEEVIRVTYTERLE